MNVLVLKEVNAKAPGDSGLLDLFQHCREHVVAVAATPLMPDCLAITTRNGFVELVDTGSGGFRLFLPHLDRLPLDAALRCFALVPGLTEGGPHVAFSLAYGNELLLGDTGTGATRVLAAFTARPRALFCDGDHVVCGDGAGTVAVWRTTPPTPPAAWNSTGAAPEQTGAVPAPLWRRAVAGDAVTHLRVDGDRLVCASADGRCGVLSVSTGVELVRLAARELDPLVAVLTFGGPGARGFAAAVALVSAAQVAVYVSPPAPAREGGGPTAGLAGASVAVWSRARSVALDVAHVRCAAHLHGVLAVGTADGVVALYTCEADDGRGALTGAAAAAVVVVEELVRFDVGHAVVGLQLYPGGTLVVVTAAGDVWRWPLRDLLESAEDAERTGATGGAEVEPCASACERPHPSHEGGAGAEAASSDEDDTGPQPFDTPPLPTARRPPVLDCTAAPDSPTRTRTPTPTAAPSSADSVGSGRADAGAGAVDGVAHDHSPTAAAAEEGAPTLYDPHTSLSSLPSPARVGRRADPDGEDGGGGGEVQAGSWPSPAGVDNETERVGWGAEGPPRSRCPPPLTRADTAAAAPPSPRSARASSAATTPSQGEAGVTHRRAQARGESPSPRTETMTTAGSPSPRTRRTLPTVALLVEPHMERYRAAQAAAIHRVLGRPPSPAAMGAATAPIAAPARTPPATPTLADEEAGGEAASGARASPRMSHRRARLVLETAAVNREADALPPVTTDVALQSTAALLAAQGAMSHETFDAAAYARAHPLESAALPYRHPIRPFRYAPHERVFAAVTGEVEAPPGITAEGGAGVRAIAPGPTGAAAAAGGPAHVDELMDATYGRHVRRPDPVWVRERQRPGPDIHDHPCGALLYGASDPSATVLFKEYQMRPVAPQPLMLPMPLPPTPSVF